jgi:hypothetical protein
MVVMLGSLQYCAGQTATVLRKGKPVKNTFRQIVDETRKAEEQDSMQSQPGGGVQ